MQTNNELALLENSIAVELPKIELVLQQLQRVVIGQPQLLNLLLIGALTNGHILLEGVPGVAKTLAITSFAKSVNASVHRIQFTPDLLPSDVIGTLIFNPKTAEFDVKKGPIFSNIIIADEINRAPAKVQSALLEAMQEKQVTIGNDTYALPAPFWVLATQNPLEQEGTYVLPEAQLDRFMLMVQVPYPSFESELQVVQQYINAQQAPEVQRVLSWQQVAQIQQLVKQVYASDAIVQYVVSIVQATRAKNGTGGYSSYILSGASPRASLALVHAAKAQAFLQGRAFVLPEDVQILVNQVLAHRMVLTYEALANGVQVEELISHIVSSIPIP
ncbi:MAG: MoxR family ATPase [Bacteroidetes bacterium]|nr:MAG: MoxR family ATPase [Bacteroidota bacterium]